jgi:hypothetical protein
MAGSSLAIIIVVAALAAWLSRNRTLGKWGTFT